MLKLNLHSAVLVERWLYDGSEAQSWRLFQGFWIIWSLFRECGRVGSVDVVGKDMEGQVHCLESYLRRRSDSKSCSDLQRRRCMAGILVRQDGD